MFEFRLYYDDAGKVIGYSADNSGSGNYIIIDSKTYHEGRIDLRVVNGKIVRDSEFIVLSKLVESTKGIQCEPEDICVITKNEPNIKWKLKIDEFRRC